MTKRTLYAVGALVSLALAILFTVNPFSTIGEHEAEPLVAPAPPLTITTPDGDELNLEDLRGKVVLVNLWATWCGPCKREMPDFVELVDQYGDRFAVLGVNLEEGKTAEVAQFAKRYSLNFPVGWAKPGQLDAWVARLDPNERNVVPISFLVDTEGVVRFGKAGYQEKAVWTALVLPLLPRDN